MKRFITWNVNGLRAILSKDFEKQFKELDADAFGLQEIRLQEGQVDFSPEGYYAYWNYGEQKGYSGTAFFVKEKPLSVRYGIGYERHDTEGRAITLEYEDYWLITVYVPNSGSETKRLDYRMDWEDCFLEYVKELEKEKPVIWCGDLNVAHEEIDLKNPGNNHNSAGFTDEERACMTRVLENGFVDSYRFLYPEKVEYSWWSYRFGARKRNAGWRIDYFIVSEKLKDRISDVIIHTDIMGSDHCPVELRMDF